MAFAPPPPRSNAPSQLLPLSAILAATGGSSGSSVASPGTVTISTYPTAGTTGAALAVAGAVSPGGTAVQVGLSASATATPMGLINATVAGGGWTANVTPASAGTYFLWAIQTAAPSVTAVSTAIVISALGSASIAISSLPTTGTAGSAFAVAGTVSPLGAAVQIGMSNSATLAPTSWTNATVSGTGWTASLTPSAAGTFYIWAEQTSQNSVQTVSAAIAISSLASSGSALSYSLVSGSGNGSLSGVTLTSGTAYTVDWTSVIAPGATDVRPGVVISNLGTIASCKFWFDTNAANTAVPTSNYGNAGSLSNNQINFYASNTGYGTPTAAPAAPSTAGTYYGKYAMYDASNNLLGIFVTSAIDIT